MNEPGLERARVALHDAMSAFLWVDGAGPSERTRVAIRLSQAEQLLAGAEAALRASPVSTASVRLGLVMRRVLKTIDPQSRAGASTYVRRDIAHVERALRRLERLIGD